MWYGAMNDVIVLLTILYQAMDPVVQVCTPCATWSWTRSTELWILLYQDIDCMLQGCVSYATEWWTCSTRPWTMSYRDMDHIVPAIDHMVEGYLPCATGL